MSSSFFQNNPRWLRYLVYKLVKFSTSILRRHFNIGVYGTSGQSLRNYIQTICRYGIDIPHPVIGDLTCRQSTLLCMHLFPDNHFYFSLMMDCPHINVPEKIFTSPMKGTTLGEDGKWLFLLNSLTVHLKGLT